MTGKEEIQKYIDNIKPYVPIRRININIADMVDMLERAVKNLEVLEILKNILKIKKSDLYGFEIIVRGSDEQENKIKEWLEND